MDSPPPDGARIDTDPSAAARARELTQSAARRLAAGEAAAAIEALREAVALAPDRADAHANLASALWAGGEHDAALAACDRALALDPSLVAAQRTRAVALLRLGRLHEALQTQSALAREHPGSADVQYSLGQIQLALGRYDEALSSTQAVLALAPNHAGAQLDSALALAALGRLEEARAALDRLDALDPRFVRATLGLSAGTDASGIALEPLHIYLDRGFDRLARADWADRDAYLARFAAFAAGTDLLDPGLQPLAYHALSLPIEPEQRRNIARRLANGQTARWSALPAPPAARPGRVRVGYLSPDFREHTNGFLTRPLFRLADRARIEVFAYNLDPGDGGECREHIRSAAEHLVDLSRVDDEAAARRIRADGIDVLVDLGGYTAGARPGILARRPARAQVGYLGFPGSMQAGFVDYRISDAVATPPGSEGDWSEQLVLLPSTFYLYDRDEPRPAAAPARAEYGLPDGAVVFCALHQPYKIEPVMFDLWVRLLSAVPGSVLWLPGYDRRAVDALTRAAAARGIGAQRLRFAPYEARPRYFARFALADLLLDTRLFNAMTTACDALWMGLPVIACAGGSFPARVSQSLLTAAGLADQVACDLPAYERLALALARDSAARAALKVRVGAARDSALFDTAGRVRELEAAWLAIAQRARAGKPAAPIAVSAANALSSASLAATPGWF
jgi:predicted O-linked N-acetylglucosamine transferase (SPINDLY family)